MDLTDTIIPRSDQVNGDDLLTGPRTVTITDVRSGSAEQPVDIHLAEYPGRPFKPSKTVRRILVAAWGKDGDAYVGRRLVIYRDPDVKFGGQDVGGIRVSHMSHIDKPMKLALTVSKGKKAPYVIKPLADDAPAPSPKVPDYMADARAAKTLDEWREVWQRADAAGHLNDALKAELTPIGAALKAKVDDETAGMLVISPDVRVTDEQGNEL
jgi:hypothetical protein